MNIILASTSVYRKNLLSKLGLPFECMSPDTDETAIPGEDAKSLVKRLALEKARSVANNVENALVIGSDQVASIDNQILGKPGSFKKAEQQLSLCSGNTVTFYTGLCVINTKSKVEQIEVDQFDVCFRELSQQQIQGYLYKEEPFDCAGSFKSEGLGISLFSAMNGKDPNALVGLPLITLTAMLQKESVDPLTYEG